jgi:hypothetical protein
MLRERQLKGRELCVGKEGRVGMKKGERAVVFLEGGEGEPALCAAESM